MDRKRQPNFSAEEIESLLSAVEKKNRVLFSKFSSVVTTAAKDKCWEEVS